MQSALFSVFLTEVAFIILLVYSAVNTIILIVFPLVTPFEAPVRSVTCHQLFKARIDESRSSSRSSSIIGTSWDRVCLQVSVRYVLPVATICAIILCHGTKGLAEVTSQGCWGNFFYTSPLSKSRTADWLQNWRLITIQSRVSCCHCTLWGRVKNRVCRDWCTHYRSHSTKCQRFWMSYNFLSTFIYKTRQTPLHYSNTSSVRSEWFLG